MTCWYRWPAEWEVSEPGMTIAFIPCSTRIDRGDGSTSACELPCTPPPPPPACSLSSPLFLFMLFISFRRFFSLRLTTCRSSSDVIFRMMESASRYLALTSSEESIPEQVTCAVILVAEQPLLAVTSPCVDEARKRHRSRE